MNAKSVKRAFGLAAAAVGASGAMMLAPAVANAATARPVHMQATAHPVHMQTVGKVGNVSKPSDGWGGGGDQCGCGWNRHDDFLMVKEKVIIKEKLIVKEKVVIGHDGWGGGSWN